MFGIFEMVAINFNICTITRDTILKHPYPNKFGNLPYVRYLSFFRWTRFAAYGIGAIQACRLNTILKHTAHTVLADSKAILKSTIRTVFFSWTHNLKILVLVKSSQARDTILTQTVQTVFFYEVQIPPYSSQPHALFSMTTVCSF